MSRTIATAAFRHAAAEPGPGPGDGRQADAAESKAMLRSTPTSALTELAHWAGFVASIATILFVTLYPHPSSGGGPGQDLSYRATLDGRTIDADGDPVTATLVNRTATPGIAGNSAYAR